MKNILLLVHPDPGQEARLQAALDVTRGVRGHLTCLEVRALEPAPSAAFSGDASVFLLEDGQQAAENRAALQKRLGLEDVSWTWLDSAGYMATCLEESAALMDLIVVDRRPDRFPVPDMRSVTAELILGTGKPVLAVPEHATGIDVAGQVLVGWDGSGPAASALQAAIPLLQRARGVTLLEVDDGTVHKPAEDAAAYLSRHDVHCELDRRQGLAGDILFERCASGAFAYLIMGGFSHSRLREALLGGVTRRMLRHSPIPLFLAH